MTESILIITIYMTPYTPSWGACQRIYFLSEYLQNMGLNVFVISLKHKVYNDFGKQISFSSIPIECKYFPMQNKMISVNNDPNNNYIKVKTVEYSMKIIKKLGISLERIFYNEINPSQGILGMLFLKDAKADIREIIRAHNIKKAIISGPPFSLFSITKFLKTNFKDFKVILDYRDPWNLWEQGSFISFYKEKANLHLADQVVFINERLRDDTIQQFGLDKVKCHVVFNGYSDTDWQNVINKYVNDNLNRDKLIISYIGSISFKEGGYRDLSVFWSAISKFKYLDELVIRFIGVDISDKTNKLKDLFGESVEFIPKVSYERSLHSMLDSDVLLLVHTNKYSAKYILTGKFFDYARSGKVILGIADSTETYFLDLIKDYHLGITSLNTEDHILKALNLIYHKWHIDKLHELRKTPNEGLEIFSRDVQNQKYYEILHNI